MAIGKDNDTFSTDNEDLQKFLFFVVCLCSEKREQPEGHFRTDQSTKRSTYFAFFD